MAVVNLSESGNVNLTVQLARDAPVVVVRHYAPHPCGGYYMEDAEVLGLNWKARPVHA